MQTLGPGSGAGPAAFAWVGGQRGRRIAICVVLAAGAVLAVFSAQFLWTHATSGPDGGDAPVLVFDLVQTASSQATGTYGYNLTFTFVAPNLTAADAQFAAESGTAPLTVPLHVALIAGTGVILAEFNSSDTCWHGLYKGCTGPFSSMGGWVSGGNIGLFAGESLVVTANQSLSSYPFYVGVGNATATQITGMPL
jgi:hypothetical protein